MSRNAVRITLILVTIVAEALLFLAALGVALAASGRDEDKWAIRLLLAQMPILAVGALACMVARPWPTRLALIIGFVLFGVDAALIVVEFRRPGDSTWPVALFALPATVLGGVWLMGRATFKPPR